MPAALSFIAIGSANAQNVSVSQSGNVSGFSVSGCAGIATETAPQSGTFTVTPIAAGTCTLTVTGAAGLTATIAVTVTTTAIITQ